jgi:NAD(P)-dependent dehydrogenase (short-subunit alcohol dehydrogenase family)
MRLQNKFAVITGAGTGIGEAIARKFAREAERVNDSGTPGVMRLVSKRI